MSNEVPEAISRTELEAVIKSQQDQIEYLKHTVEKLQKLLHGRSSEKLPTDPSSPIQGQLFEHEEPLGEIELPHLGEVTPPRRRSSKPRFPKNVEREVVEIEVPEGDRSCESCGKELRKIGFEACEQAHYIPAKLKVREIHRFKYGCAHCKGAGIRIAPVPPTAFPKTRITTEMRANIVVQKFVDHCPYYRQSAILRRHGFEISDASLGRYALEAADVLAPIALAMRDELLESGYLQADETTIPVLKTEKSTPGAHHGWLWSYGRPHGTVIFNYQATRSQDSAESVLGDFAGKLQTDRYSGYNRLRGRVIDIGCWAHARRKFLEAEKTARSRTKKILNWISKLYAVESEARDLQLGPAQDRKFANRRANLS